MFAEILVYTCSYICRIFLICFDFLDISRSMLRSGRPLSSILGSVRSVFGRFVAIFVGLFSPVRAAICVSHIHMRIHMLYIFTYEHDDMQEYPSEILQNMYRIHSGGAKRPQRAEVAAVDFVSFFVDIPAYHHVHI